MHELSIAQGILDLVRQHVPETQASQVRNVELRLGRMCGVVPESLSFCFEAVVAGSPFAQARLAIEQVPVRGVCRAYAATFEISEPVCLCPGCGSGQVRMTSGDEMHVVQIELADEPVEAP